MDLLEYQGKQLFARSGVAVPEGRVAADVETAVAGADEVGYPCVVKAQVRMGGRGKAGGIKIAKGAAEAREHAAAILGKELHGPHGEGPYKVHQLWIEGASEIDAEYYASLILDRAEKKPLAMLSRMGGMDVEEIAERDPEALTRMHVDPSTGLSEADACQLALDAGIDEDVVSGVAAALVALYGAFTENDATLIEVNPLVVSTDREVIALDSKVTIDDSALFRHDELAEDHDAPGQDPQERMAKEKGVTYVKLEGDIGVLGNGAGLCMSTLDVVANVGGSPANFLDAGGGSHADAIVDALEVITSDEKVRGLLFNIFGGITRGDEVATGIIEAYQRVDLDMPVVVRLDGTNSEQGLGMLADAELPNLHVERTMLGAAESIVELAG